MSRIPESLVRTIIDRTDIVRVIGERVRLEKKGGRYWGLCPFHGEKTPSFSVDPDKRFFYCFGCRKGGDAVAFLREIDKLSYREALEELAAKAGVPLEVDEESSAEELARKALLELNERLTATFHYFLTSHPSGNAARELLRRRAVPDTFLEEFRLGYAPRSRSWLSDFLRKKGYSSSFLAKTGLFSERYPDFPLFSDRLIFPIVEARGRILAFGGRLLEGEGPKYINSPDTLLFHKQENLFALDRAAEAIKKNSEALVCEGYMDAISFHVAGLRAAVAPLGTAFTERQASLLRRWAERVVFAFDADEAGQKAAERAVVLAARTGLEGRVALMPGGKDASEILEKEGPESLQKLSEFTINGGEFLVRRARDLFDISTVEGKAKAAAFLNPYIEALDTEVKRESFFDHAARELGLRSSHAMILDYREGADRAGGRNSAREGRERGQKGELGARDGVKRTPELLFLAATAIHAESFPQIRTELSLEDFSDPAAKDLYIALEESFRADEAGMDAVLKRVRTDDLRTFLLETAASGEFSEQPERFIEDGLLGMRLNRLERRRERVLGLMAEGGGEEMSLQDLLCEKMYLDAEIARLKGERDERS